MTAPQSPAPPQSLLDEMAAALEATVSALLVIQSPTIDASLPESRAKRGHAAVEQGNKSLVRYRAATAAEPDIATTLEKLIRACTPTRRGKEAGEVPMSGSRMPEQAIVEQANLVLAEYRAALAAAQAKEGRDE